MDSVSIAGNNTCTFFIVDLKKLARKVSSPWEIIENYFYVIILTEIPMAIIVHCSA